MSISLRQTEFNYIITIITENIFNGILVKISSIETNRDPYKIVLKFD